ncbi:hypothetical protein L210DRAFT_3508275 [Boletus edulis BED1]|uniref:Uncharacterized protein n=1 Tax=Boletus edulis BED1 TaxID=1328754 RepID=A0AAD4G9K3_BOLED|nr:hypothetical protein L210DRAFT_3508275 [Boletus edulis BED1]
MPAEPRAEVNVNPFASPIKTRTPFAPTTTSDTKAQQPDVLATADLSLEQPKELEKHCSTVEERVRRKRKALKELEYLILGPNSAEGSPRQANLDAIQTCLDYSPETQAEDDLGIQRSSPFDDKHALRQSPLKVEKSLSTISREGTGEVLAEKSLCSKTRFCVKEADGSTTERCGAEYLTSSPSQFETPRPGSWKRSILRNPKPKGGATEKKTARDSARRKEKRKGLWKAGQPRIDVRTYLVKVLSGHRTLSSVVGRSVLMLNTSDHVFNFSGLTLNFLGLRSLELLPLGLVLTCGASYDT